jgi:hypothetical protein
MAAGYAFPNVNACPKRAAVFCSGEPHRYGDSQMDNEQTRRPSMAPIVMAIIAAAVLIVVALVVMEQRREYNAMYPGCWTLIDDGPACEAQVSAAALRGY